MCLYCSIKKYHRIPTLIKKADREKTSLIDTSTIEVSGSRIITL